LQFAKAVIHRLYELNVGILRHTGHSTDLMPTAAMAEKQTIFSLSAVSAKSAEPKLTIKNRLPDSSRSPMPGTGRVLTSV
jgi:hypothetical protein